MENTAQPPLILASGSIYKRQLLARLQLPFTCLTPDVDEAPHAHEDGAALARRLAGAKALAVAENRPAAVVIGADQVAECGTHLLGKPGSVERAVEQLQYCRGQTVVFHTALTVARGQTDTTVSVPTTVRFRELDDDRIRRYVEVDRPLDCAGAFKSESLGIALVESIASDDPTALIGLPLIAAASLLEAFGITLPRKS